MTNNENELLDVYGEDGMETGEVLPREEIHKYGILHRTTHVWLLNSAGSLLLQKRAMSRKKNPGKWTSPGGHINTQEESKVSAARELFEEMGIEKEPEELLYLGTIRNMQYVSDVYTENEIMDIYVTPVALEPEEIRPTDEVSESRYFTVVDLENQYASLNPEFVYYPESFSLIKEYIYGPGQN